jgi:hypothetical protein
MLELDRAVLVERAAAERRRPTPALTRWRHQQDGRQHDAFH